MKQKVIWGALIVAAAVVYFTFNPASSALFPKCPFFMLTGLKCPGCGSQRAIHALLNLDITGAFSYNALLVVFIPVAALLFYSEFNRIRKPKLYLYSHNVYFIWTCFAVIVLWWVFRNVLSF